MGNTQTQQTPKSKTKILLMGSNQAVKSAFFGTLQLQPQLIGKLDALQHYEVIDSDTLQYAQQASRIQVREVAKKTFPLHLQAAVILDTQVNNGLPTPLNLGYPYLSHLQYTRTQLAELTADPLTTNLPVLIFANFPNGLPSSINTEEMAQRMGLSFYKQKKNLRVQVCCQTTGEGVAKGFSWLRSVIDGDLPNEGKNKTNNEKETESSEPEEGQVPTVREGGAHLIDTLDLPMVAMLPETPTMPKLEGVNSNTPWGVLPLLPLPNIQYAQLSPQPFATPLNGVNNLNGINNLNGVKSTDPAEYERLQQLLLAQAQAQAQAQLQAQLQAQAYLQAQQIQTQVQQQPAQQQLLKIQQEMIQAQQQLQVLQLTAQAWALRIRQLHTQYLQLQQQQMQQQKQMQQQQLQPQQQMQQQKQMQQQPMQPQQQMQQQQQLMQQKVDTPLPLNQVTTKLEQMKVKQEHN